MISRIWMDPRLVMIGSSKYTTGTSIVTSLMIWIFNDWNLWTNPFQRSWFYSYHDIIKFTSCSGRLWTTSPHLTCGKSRFQLILLPPAPSLNRTKKHPSPEIWKKKDPFNTLVIPTHTKQQMWRQALPPLLWAGAIDAPRDILILHEGGTVEQGVARCSAGSGREDFKKKSFAKAWEE